MRNNFKQNLKYYRRLQKLTQEQLAEKINVSKTCVSNWETGLREAPIDSLIKLAEVFEISLDELILY